MWCERLVTYSFGNAYTALVSWYFLSLIASEQGVVNTIDMLAVLQFSKKYEIVRCIGIEAYSALISYSEHK